MEKTQIYSKDDEVIVLSGIEPVETIITKVEYSDKYNEFLYYFNINGVEYYEADYAITKK